MDFSTTFPLATSLQLQTTQNWIRAFESYDVDTLFSMVTEDFTYNMIPSTLGHPQRNKAEFARYCNALKHAFGNFKIGYDEVIENPGKIVLQWTTNGVSRTGLPYSNEATTMFYFIQDSSSGEFKISTVKEFIDSKGISEFLAQEKSRQVTLLAHRSRSGVENT
ncbi:hypothetical protein M422DRAFT_43928 [Sphaerobolus stellatus SS14]|nr:hypothetical protein M422DRAFT_43928 [Sphaerobolus stellatus SS14]